MIFGSIESERSEKLKTLLTDCVDTEVRKTTEAVYEHLSGNVRQRWDETLKFALHQEYGARDLDKYYVTHPLRLCRFLAKSLDRSYPHFEEVLTAAIIHNVIEKKVYSHSELSTRYTPWVADAILTLTPDRKSLQTEEGKHRYYAGISGHGKDVKALKIFDKFDNLFSVCLCPDPTIREDYLLEAEMHLRPFIKELFPDLTQYFDDLIEDNRQLGYFRPTVD